MPSPAAGTQPPQEAGQTRANRLESSFVEEEMRTLVYRLRTGQATSGCCAQHWAGPALMYWSSPGEAIEMVRAGALSVGGEAEGPELVQPGKGKLLVLAAP